MIIEINDKKTIEEICKAFSEHFPFLKLEFYNVPHHWQEESLLKNMMPHDKTIAEVRKRHNPGAMEIHFSLKTGTVEQEFQKKFGLNVQVFRKQGAKWVQSVGTDELTLQEQNQIGEKASLDMLHGTDRKFQREKNL